MNIFLSPLTKKNAAKKWVLTNLLLSQGHTVVENPEYADVEIGYLDEREVKNITNPLILIRDIHKKPNKTSINFIEVTSNLAVPVNLAGLDKKTILVDKVYEKRSVKIIQFDFVSFLFGYLAEEEYLNNNRRDHFNRLTFSLSEKQDNEIDKPFLNYWALYLNVIIKETCLENKIFYHKKKLWPNNSESAISFSHDVDIVDYNYVGYWKSFFGGVLRKETSILNFIGCFIDDLRYRIFGNNTPYKNYQLDSIRLKHRENNIKASFNIITSNFGKLDNPNYVHLIKDEVRLLMQDEHEIGLHGGFQSKSFENEDEFKREKDQLEKLVKQKIVSTRQHYLGFNSSRTFEIQEKNGIKIDSTVGYPDAPGFKSGFAHPYRNWSLKNDESLTLIELPLILMDGTLMSKVYGNMKLAKAKEIFIHFLKETNFVNGVLTINWHQRVFSAGLFKTWMKLYDFILEEVKNQNLYIDTKKNIVSRYFNISSIYVTFQENLIKIHSKAKIENVYIELDKELEIKETDGAKIKQIDKVYYLVLESLKKEEDKIIEFSITNT